MFPCMAAPFVAHQSRGGAVSIRRCSLESVCASAQIVIVISQTPGMLEKLPGTRCSGHLGRHAFPSASRAAMSARIHRHPSADLNFLLVAGADWVKLVLAG